MLLKMRIIISACYGKVFLLKSKLFQLLPINLLLAKLLLQFVFVRCRHRHVVAAVLMQSRLETNLMCHGSPP